MASLVSKPTNAFIYKIKSELAEIVGTRRYFNSPLIRELIERLAEYEWKSINKKEVAECYKMFSQAEYEFIMTDSRYFADAAQRVRSGFKTAYSQYVAHINTSNGNTDSDSE